LSWGLCALAGGACSSNQSEDVVQAEGDPAVRAVFELGPAPMPWGAIPWPNDLYLEAGHLAVTSLPVGPEVAEELEGALTTLDGVGTRPLLVFDFDGELDAESLPASPDDSMGPDASVFLIDADASSPDAFERLPLAVELSSDRRSIRARLAFDRGLAPGRRYAAVVTTAVRARLGNHRVRGAERFVRLLDQAEAPEGALELRARQQYLPILSALASEGVPADRVVALSSFRVQSIERDLDDARAIVVSEPLEALSVERVIEGDGLDTALGVAPEGGIGAVLAEGVAHQHLAALIHVSVRAPRFANVDDGERNAIVRDADGLRRRGDHLVPCTLTVPRSIGSAALSLVLFQHGLFGERSDGLALANELAAAGHALLTCDAPLHGSRLPNADTGNRFTSEPEPDGFGDRAGDVLGLDEDAGELQAAHPFYFRDATQQAVIDWMSIVQTLRSGLWAEALGEALQGDAVTIATDSIGFVGVDIGAEIGVALGAREPEIRAIVLAFAGGRGIDDWGLGPDYKPLREALGSMLTSRDGQGFAPEFRADVDVYRMLTDPVSGVARGARLLRSPTNVLQYIAAQDELVPLASSEALAYALGAALVDAEPQHEPDLRRDLGVPGTAISDNFPLSRGAVTRVAQMLAPAARSTLFSTTGFLRFEHPLESEPVALDDDSEIANPTASAMRQIVFFFESHRACRAAEPDPLLPCAASVSALRMAR
jgi:hypothetical protein